MDDAWIALNDVARLRARLHDTVLQTLEFIASGGTLGAAADSEALMRIAAREATELRQLLEGVVAGTEAGLTESIEAIVEQERIFAAHEIYVRVEAADGSLRGLVCIDLANAVREALTNARKHARATSVTVRIVEAGGRAMIVVTDNGAGTEPATLMTRLGVKHSIIGRMTQLGGTAEIATAPGNGVTITLAIDDRVQSFPPDALSQRRAEVLPPVAS